MLLQLQVDKLSKFIAFGMRYYDPSIGRWTTPDPAGFLDGSNLYAYVHNNPLQYSDRFGLFADNLLWLLTSHPCFESMYQRLCVPLGMGQFCDPGQESVWHFNIEDKLEEDYYFGNKETDPTFHRTKTYCANDFINPETGQHYQFKELPRGKKVFYMNGNCNTLNDFQTSLLSLANGSGYNIYGIFCPTFGTTIDILCYKHALFDGAAYEGVRELQKHIKEFHANNSPGATMLVISHSRAGVYVRNTLRDSPQEERDRVECRAYCSGGYIDRHLCKSVVHYESKRDLVPMLDASGRQRCKDTIVRLEPNAPWNWKQGLWYWNDHGFTSKTFVKSQIRNIHEYADQ
jgi:RHS repeat-associated protein